MLFAWGLLLFLSGMEGAKWTLRKGVSGKLEAVLSAISSNIFSCILLGVIVTALIQSSSAVSVILIGLIEARVISLKPAIGIIMGANIGTTVTVQIISLPVVNLYPWIIIIGLLISIIGLFKSNKLFFTGLTMVFFGIVFAGLFNMTSFFKDQGIMNLFQTIFAYTGDNTLKGIIIGFFVTIILQSSSAVTGMSLGLARSGIINLASSVAIALGSNIGTCITAFIASFNCGRVSKMMAVGHFVFNLIGVLAIMPFFNTFCQLVEQSSADLLRQIANAHTLFNLYNVLIFIPFVGIFTKLLGGDRNGVA